MDCCGHKNSRENKGNEKDNWKNEKDEASGEKKKGSRVTEITILIILLLIFWLVL
ncbi:MAG: hypothetical protein Q8P57_00070 [Candidatus Pacearchaeota archaeon]|nr:hypothetical protein [Candidatus Pacearchaeota archaeon]